MVKRAAETIILLLVFLVLGLLIFAIFGSSLLTSLSPYSSASKQAKEYSTNIGQSINTIESLLVNKKQLTYESVFYDPFARPFQGQVVETQPFVWKYNIEISGTTLNRYANSFTVPLESLKNSIVTNFPFSIDKTIGISGNCQTPTSITLPGSNRGNLGLCEQSNSLKIEYKPNSGGNYAQLSLALVCRKECKDCKIDGNKIKFQKVFSDRLDGNNFVLTFDECIRLFVNGYLDFPKTVNGKNCDYKLVLYYNNGGNKVLFKILPKPTGEADIDSASLLASYVIAGYVCETLFRYPYSNSKSVSLAIESHSSLNIEKDLNGKTVDYVSAYTGGSSYTVEIKPSTLDDRGQCVIRSKWGQAEHILLVFPSSSSACVDAYKQWKLVLNAILSSQVEKESSNYWYFLKLGIDSIANPLNYVIKGYLFKYPLDFLLISPKLCQKLDPSSFINTCPDEILSSLPKDRRFDLCIICNNYAMRASTKDKAIPSILVKDYFTGNLMKMSQVCWLYLRDTKDACSDFSKKYLEKVETTAYTDLVTINRDSQGTLVFLTPTQNTIICQLVGKIDSKRVNFFFITSENICKALGGNKATIPLYYLMGKLNTCFFYKVNLKGKPFLVISNAYLDSNYLSQLSRLKLMLPIPQINTPNLQIKDNYLIIGKNCLDLTNIAYDTYNMYKAYCCVMRDGDTVKFQGGMYYPAECSGIWLESNCAYYLGT